MQEFRTAAISYSLKPAGIEKFKILLKTVELYDKAGGMMSMPGYELR